MFISAIESNIVVILSWVASIAVSALAVFALVFGIRKGIDALNNIGDDESDERWHASRLRKK